MIINLLFLVYYSTNIYILVKYIYLYAVAEVLSRNFPVPQEFVGMPDHFGESGEPNELIAKWGMDSKAIISAVKKVLKRK